MHTAYFAAGCFWGVEACFQQQTGVKTTSVGYMGGKIENPSYRQVSTGQTGHAEAVQIEYIPNQTSFEKLAKTFFELHDPAQTNGQGRNVGSQYRSAIFYTSKEQKQTAEKLIKQLTKQGYDVTTEVVKAGEFWPAESCHQDYYRKQGMSPVCQAGSPKFDQQQPAS